ncbi:cytochrome b5 domain-containing protein [Streptomyces sp. NPDC048636]|uniref:cytochrome b5 domain-containing protein n=1 Tax=Streptomyces sp. NPDC048636 TaxID=3155762 RepID=UPI00344024FF
MIDPRPHQTPSESLRATGAPAVPSRRVLESAEEYNAAHGHELRGFLSSSSGFIPKLPTVRSFPASHTAWDVVIARMPELWRTVTLRQTLCEMPVLGAGPEDLPDAFVWRASVAMSVFAHAFVRVETLPDDGLPPSITVPWAQISERLGRREPHMSYNDLIVYNHSLRDANLPDPHQVENMELLVPSVDNREERRFYLAQVEILARSAPIVTAVVRAQEAVARDDRDALAAELTLMLRTWRDITELSFRKVDPNPLSATFVDQVVWANTVAPLAVPIKAGTAGPGGEASPVFHLMDAFLGRKHKESRLGKEVAELREWFPPHHIAFIEAVEEVSVRDYVAASGDRRLQNLFSTLFDAYAGKKGYLGTHRMKVYGFLELAFKVGRSKTITGIVGGFKEQHWKTLDEILEETRLERYRELPPHVQHARIRTRTPAAEEGEVTHVVLDASETGALYRPGDRCGVLPTNRPETVEATLRALGATGEEEIPLTAAWREAIRYRARHPLSTDTLPLRTFLSYAKLRPLTGDLVGPLLKTTGSAGLRAVAGSRGLARWELSDALALLNEEGHPLHRMLTAGSRDAWSLARLVPPEDFRMYSVSSAPAHGAGELSEEVRLTVARLSHRADDDSPRGPAAELLGTASAFLTSAGTESDAVPLQLVRPSRFGLPRDSSRPLVMFAAGVGVSAFLGFLAHRRTDPSAGQNWLFLGARSHRHVYGEPEIHSAVAEGKLALYIAFSAEDGGVRAGFGGPARTVTTPAGRLHDVLADDPEAQRTLWDLLRGEEDGGQGAHFYVCGRAEFAGSVMAALQQVAARFSGPDERPETVLPRLVAEGRYLQDVFSSWTPDTADGPVYDVSEVARHTTAEAGQWMILDGEVYDLTEFLHLHPGGPRILTENIGLDATTEYRAVLHHENSEINAMLAMYRIGTVRRLDLGDRRGTAVPPGHDPVEISLDELYRCWVRLLHLLTAMSNALANDWCFMTGAMTRGDDPEGLNALKAQYASNAHQRFLGSYFQAALTEELPSLWALTTALAAPQGLTRDLGGELTRTMAEPDALAAARFAEEFRTAYRSVDGDPTAVDDSTWSALRTVCAEVRKQDMAFLEDLRSAIRDGVMVFEELEARAATDGGERLIAVLDAIPALVRFHHKALLSGLAPVWPIPSGSLPSGSVPSGADTLRSPG